MIMTWYLTISIAILSMHSCAGMMTRMAATTARVESTILQRTVPIWIQMVCAMVAIQMMTMTGFWMSMTWTRVTQPSVKM